MAINRFSMQVVLMTDEAGNFISVNKASGWNERNRVFLTHRAAPFFSVVPTATR